MEADRTEYHSGYHEKEPHYQRTVVGSGVSWGNIAHTVIVVVNMVNSALHRFLVGAFQNSSHKWIFHYEQEIMRHQNQLQFIFRKTLRAMGTTVSPNRDPSLFWFIIFRIHWEKATLPEIRAEISKIRDPLMQKNFFSRFYSKVSSFSWKIALKFKNQEERWSLEYALPSFFISTLSKSNILDNSNLNAQIQAITSTPETGLFGAFIPTSSSPTTSEIQQEFKRFCEKHGIPVQVHPKIPQLYSIPNKFKSRVVSSSLVQQNLLYIAELPSFLSIFAAGSEYRKSQTTLACVLDYCAAPGSKTRLIRSFFGYNTRIIAQDIHLSRLKLVSRLLYPQIKSQKKIHTNYQKASSLSLIQADGINTPYRHPLKPDIILLDAPCTGSGTLYSTPELKWRQSPSFLRRHVDLQRQLIQNAIDLLKPGGIFIYSTCSMYPEEGEYQMAHFSDQLVPCALPTWFPRPYSHLVTPSTNNIAMARFSPATTKTMGFFFSLFRKMLN
ncbi:MAG: hypothetical protein ACTSYI_15685 [Promethearchaeota archaeon]